MIEPIPLLTIAGSDSGGAAGLQADLKTWAALGRNGRGLYGMSAITAVTAQNSERVAAVHYLPPDFVAAQIDAVLSDYGAAAIKTGFLGRVEIIEAVAERLAYWGEYFPDLSGRRTGVRLRPDRSHAKSHARPSPFVIIDPVLVNHRGEAMFGPEVAAAYRELLFPLADLVTPNRREVELLGIVGEKGGGGAEEQRSGGEMSISSAPLLPISSTPLLLLKGWRKDAAEIVDLYWDGLEWMELRQPRVDTINTHGSGDTLSAAICAFVAMGFERADAIRRARSFTHEAIRRGALWQMGAGHGPLGY